MFQEGDKVRLKEGLRGYPPYIEPGTTYVVGGPLNSLNDRSAGLVGLITPDGKTDQWFSKDFEHAGGPW